MDAQKREEVLKRFNTACEICSKELGTLKNAIQHYKKFHEIVGYLKCCRLRFKKEADVEDHIKYHINPDIFKYAINTTH